MRSCDSWWDMLKNAFEEDSEDFSGIICTLSEEELKRKFNAGHGSTEGQAFTAWSENWVYFPICYDGAEWVGRAPRNPCDISMSPQGGG